MVPDKKGITVREHLESVERQKGEAPPGLIGPDFPEALEYVWEWFQDLSAHRRSSEFGIESISFTDMDAWARLTGHAPTPQEVSLLIELDRTYRNINGRPRAN